MALIQFQNSQAPYLNAENLNNNFSELNNKIVVEEERIDNLTISGNTCIYQELSSTTKSGYTLIGLSVNVSGPGNGYMLVSAKLSGIVTIYNWSSTERTGIYITIKKIFLKN